MEFGKKSKGKVIWGKQKERNQVFEGKMKKNLSNNRI